MIKKISTLILVIAILATANVFASARVDGSEGDKAPVAPTSQPKQKTEARDWKAIFAANKAKPFDPASRKSTLAEHQAQQKAGKKFSTTTKVLIGAGIAAAVIAVIFVVARNDLKDDILR